MKANKSNKLQIISLFLFSLYSNLSVLHIYNEYKYTIAYYDNKIVIIPNKSRLARIIHAFGFI